MLQIDCFPKIRRSFSFDSQVIFLNETSEMLKLYQYRSGMVNAKFHFIKSFFEMLIRIST